MIIAVICIMVNILSPQNREKLNKLLIGRAILQDIKTSFSNNYV